MATVGSVGSSGRGTSSTSRAALGYVPSRAKVLSEIAFEAGLKAIITALPGFTENPGPGVRQMAPESQDELQATHRPFPFVEDWTAGGDLETAHLSQLEAITRDLDQLPQEICRKAVAAIRDVAAVETGAIENLYELERGITITAAAEGAILGNALAGQPDRVRSLIAAQMRAYDFVLDFVTNRQPLAEAWIRDLHNQLCASQTHYTVSIAPDKSEERPLRSGEYKREPNHVRTRSGETHFYAPVHETAAEMHRLVESLGSEEFSHMHPVDQAAYAHYGLVAIHPFADGNGRVARALASVYCYRRYRIPLLITVDHRSVYFDSLEQADRGRFDTFREFVRDRVVDSIFLLAESVRYARLGTPAESVAKVQAVFQTRGGYSHVEIDQAGFKLLQALQAEVKKEVEKPESQIPGLHWSVATSNTPRGIADGPFRRPISGSTLLTHIRAQTTSPAEANVEFLIGVGVPKDAARTDDFMLECPQRPDLVILIPVREVLPTRSLVADMHVALYARRVVSQIAADVAAAAQASLKSKGY
jgi:Fic family protein